jgi:succinoglycan biosynthesis protein ExoM
LDEADMMAGSVTVAIASAGRPTLVRCLRSLADLALPDDTVLDVVIADDSAEGVVAALVTSAAPLPFRVQVVHSRARNVAIARNASIEAATGDLIAFVDDDEWVEAQWLCRLLAAMTEFEADCVFGPVHPAYPTGTPDWIINANPLHVDWGHRGRRVDIGRSGNTLLKRSVVTAHNLRFDPALGRTGGEDTSFFHAVGRTGAVMVVTDDAIVHEEAPPARVNLAYFRARALRTGQMYARFVVAKQIEGRWQKLAFFGGALGKTAVAFLLGAVIYPFDRARWLKLAMRGWMNAGKLRELLKLEPGTMS